MKNIKISQLFGVLTVFLVPILIITFFLMNSYFSHVGGSAIKGKIINNVFFLGKEEVFTRVSKETFYSVYSLEVVLVIIALVTVFCVFASSFVIIYRNTTKLIAKVDS